MPTTWPVGVDRGNIIIIFNIKYADFMMDAEGHNRKMQELPIWEKPLLSVVEAAKYFQIGESNIRRLTREHKDKDFVLWKDNRVYIRRKEMESFLDTINEI